MQEFNFVTDGSVVYQLGGNEWYVVEQDDDKVMLADTDCKIGDRILISPWSDGDYHSGEGENGQCVLGYANNLADTYFSNIKHAIIPRTVEAGSGKLENAYMWPMSKEEFDGNKVIGGRIVHNTYSFVWTRTFSGVYSDSNGRCAWFVSGAGGDLSNHYVGGLYRVAPAFYLKKSSIDHITEDGEIVLKPADIDKNSTSSDTEKLLSQVRETEKLLSQVREYAKATADVNRFKQKLAYEQGDDSSAAKTQEIVDMCECILYLASNITD